MRQGSEESRSSLVRRGSERGSFLVRHPICTPRLRGGESGGEEGSGLHIEEWLRWRHRAVDMEEGAKEHHLHLMLVLLVRDRPHQHGLLLQRQVLLIAKGDDDLHHL